MRNFSFLVAVLPSAWKIVGMTILQALDKKTTPQPKKTSFSFHFFIVFNRLTVVIIWRSETGVHTYIGRASKLPQCCIKRATDADESMSVFLEQHERLSCTFSRSEFSLCFSQQSFRESYKKIWTVTNAYTRHLFIYKKKKTICISNAWQWWTCSQNIDKLINHVNFVQLEKSKLNLLTGWTGTKQITKYMSSDPGWTQNVLKYSPMKYITHAHKSRVNQKNTTDECFHTRGTCYKSLQSSVKLVKWANTQMSSNNFFFFYVACIYICTFPKRIFSLHGKMWFTDTWRRLLWHSSFLFI